MHDDDGVVVCDCVPVDASLVEMTVERWVERGVMHAVVVAVVVVASPDAREVGLLLVVGWWLVDTTAKQEQEPVQEQVQCFVAVVAFVLAFALALTWA